MRRKPGIDERLALRPNLLRKREAGIIDLRHRVPSRHRVLAVTVLGHVDREWESGENTPEGDPSRLQVLFVLFARIAVLVSHETSWVDVVGQRGLPTR